MNKIYFDPIGCLNPLKRVKFISIQTSIELCQSLKLDSLNPLKRVKFISIRWERLQYGDKIVCYSLNPLKRVKFISIPFSGDDEGSYRNPSQSPQTGQVYFNLLVKVFATEDRKEESQSPQTGQVYFNSTYI